MELLLFILLIGGGIAYAAHKFRSYTQHRADLAAQGTLPDFLALHPRGSAPPPRPPMDAPVDGEMSVAFKTTDDAIWFWIELTEQTKFAIRNEIDTPNDGQDEVDRRLKQYQDELYAQSKERTHPYSEDYIKKQLIDQLIHLHRMYLMPLRSFLQNPACHRIKNPLEAAEFLNKFKTKYLPAIKSVITATMNSEGSYKV
jgi:hypothetical protein